MNVNFILPQDKEAGRQRPSIFAASCFFLLAAAGLLLTSWIMYPVYWILARIAPGISENTLTHLTQLAYYALFVILPIAIYVKRTPDVLDAMRANPIATGDALLCALAALAGVMFVMYLGYLWTLILEGLGGVIPESGVQMPTNTGELLASILFVGVMPGICEEIMFRGMLLGAWEERGTRFAIIASSVLFASLHASIAGLPTQLILGGIMAYIVVSTGSLFAGMIYHTVHNATLLIIGYSVSGVEIDPQQAELSSYEQVGGAMGVFSILVNMALFGAILYIILRRVWLRREKRGERAFGYDAPERKRELGWTELAVIAAGLITVGMMYALDIGELAGLFK